MIDQIIAIIGVIIAVFVAIGFGNRAGKRAARKEAKRETAERAAATRKRMDDADTGNDDPAVLRDWLRERGQ